MPPRRKSATEKQLAGTDRGDRAPSKGGTGAAFNTGTPPRTPAGTPKPLATIYRRLLKIIPDTLLCTADEILVMQLAEALFLRRQALAYMSRHGVFEADMVHGGQMRKSPALTVWRMAAAEVNAIGAKFGLSPKGRRDLADLLAGDEGEEMTIRELLDFAVHESPPSMPAWRVAENE